MKSFVTGGNGFLGQGMTKALLEAGFEVRCLVRNKNYRIFGEDKGVEKFTASDNHSGRFSQGMSGCAAVFNLVGIIRELPGNGVTFKKAHPEFTALLIEACKEAGVKRYLHMSVLAVDSGLDIGYNNSKLEAEKLVRESGLDWTIVRPSLIFGAGDRFAVEFAEWMKKGVPIPVIGRGDYRLTPVSRRDLCNGLARIVNDPKTFGETYDIGGPLKQTYLEILRIIEKTVGKKARLVKIPAAFMIPTAKLLGRFPWFPATADMIKQLMKESVTDDKRFWEVNGIEPCSLEDEIGEYVV